MEPHKSNINHSNNDWFLSNFGSTTELCSQSQCWSKCPFECNCTSDKYKCECKHQCKCRWHFDCRWQRECCKCTTFKHYFKCKCNCNCQYKYGTGGTSATDCATITISAKRFVNNKIRKLKSDEKTYCTFCLRFQFKIHHHTNRPLCYPNGNSPQIIQFTEEKQRIQVKQIHQSWGDTAIRKQQSKLLSTSKNPFASP